jgi:hypothetical protein
MQDVNSNTLKLGIKMKLQEVVKTRHPKDKAENNPLVDEKHASEVAEMIATECSIMLNAYEQQSKVLYRGSTGSTTDFLEKPIRQDRKPVELNYGSHEKAEVAMKDLDIKARRTNSIFCSADMETAKDWGNVYIIFVPNGWSGTVFKARKSDYAFYDIERLYQKSYSEAKKIISGLKPHQFNDAAGLSEILENDYMDILITGEKYYGLKLGTAFCDQVLRILDLPSKLSKHND